MSGAMPPDPPPPLSEADYTSGGQRRQSITSSGSVVPGDVESNDESDLPTLCSDDIASLLTALIKATKSFSAVEKDSKNTHFKTKYASLGAYQSATRGHLAENGLIVIQLVHHNTLYTRLYHESGQWIQSQVRLYQVNKGPQALGAELTYLKRYCYSAILNISAEADDDDGESAQSAYRDSPPSNRAPPPRPSSPAASNAFRSAGLPPKVQANGHAETPHDPETGEIINDPWVVGALAGLARIKLGPEWLETLGGIYGACPSFEAVKAIDTAPSVTKALAGALPETKAKIRNFRAAAMSRLAAEAIPDSSDDTFPPDRPNA